MSSFRFLLPLLAVAACTPSETPAGGTGGLATIEIGQGGSFSGSSRTLFRSDGSWEVAGSDPFAESGAQNAGKGDAARFARARAVLEKKVPGLRPEPPEPCPEDAGTDSIRFNPPIAGRDWVSGCEGGAVGELITEVLAAWRG